MKRKKEKFTEQEELSTQNGDLLDKVIEQRYNKKTKPLSNDVNINFSCAKLYNIISKIFGSKAYKKEELKAKCIKIFNEEICPKIEYKNEEQKLFLNTKYGSCQETILEKAVFCNYQGFVEAVVTRIEYEVILEYVHDLKMRGDNNLSKSQKNLIPIICDIISYSPYIESTHGQSKNPIEAPDLKNNIPSMLPVNYYRIEEDIEGTFFGDVKKLNEPQWVSIAGD